jgi:hypothetical protein
MGCQLLPWLFGKVAKKIFHGDFMDSKQPDEAFHGYIGLTFFQPPVLHTGNFVVEREVFVTGVALFLAQFGELQADAF